MALNSEAGRATLDDGKFASGKQVSQSDFLQQMNAGPPQASTQALVDKYLAKAEGRKYAGAVPIKVSFPTVGPSLFLVATVGNDTLIGTAPARCRSQRWGRRCFSSPS